MHAMHNRFDRLITKSYSHKISKLYGRLVDLSTRLYPFEHNFSASA